MQLCVDVLLLVESSIRVANMRVVGISVEVFWRHDSQTLLRMGKNYLFFLSKFQNDISTYSPTQI